MFKVVALLAIVGCAAAGVSVRDAVALNNQIATQNAINLNGALRNGVLAGHVGALPLTYAAGLPALGYAGVPAIGYSAVSARDAVALGSQIATQNAINVNGAVTGEVNLSHQIATQNAINANGAVRNAVLSQVAAHPLTYAAGVPALGVSHLAGVPALGLGYSAVSARDAVALNNQIATQNAINSGLILG